MAYRNNYQEKFAKERRAWRRGLLDSIKLGSGCKDCGYDEHPSALQFDHVRGEKKDNIGSIYTRSWKFLKEELLKCEVVCANCHAVRTAVRRYA